MNSNYRIIKNMTADYYDKKEDYDRLVEIGDLVMSNFEFEKDSFYLWDSLCKLDFYPIGSESFLYSLRWYDQLPNGICQYRIEIPPPSLNQVNDSLYIKNMAVFTGLEEHWIDTIFDFSRNLELHSFTFCENRSVSTTKIFNKRSNYKEGEWIRCGINTYIPTHYKKIDEGIYVGVKMDQ